MSGRALSQLLTDTGEGPLLQNWSAELWMGKADHTADHPFLLQTRGGFSKPCASEVSVKPGRKPTLHTERKRDLVLKALAHRSPGSLSPDTRLLLLPLPQLFKEPHVHLDTIRNLEPTTSA